MTDFDFNSQNDAAITLASFVQLQSGSDRYRFRSLQKIDPQEKWPNLVRVSDDGKVFLSQQAIDHDVDLEIALTADEVDTANPPTNTRTISYYQYQKKLRNHVLVQVSTVYFALDAASNKFLRFNFTFELDSIGMPRETGAGDGSIHVTLHGKILEVSPIDGSDIAPTFIRQAS